MAAKKVVEWVGGVVSMPAYVDGEGEPYRPEVLLWASAEGAVLGHALGKPGALVGVAAESLRSTIERPMIGRPHAPRRVRVASPELAEALREAHPAIDVVCAPTPEIVALGAEMCGAIGEHIEPEQTYLSPDVDSEAVGAFFRAAAGLFRAKPWTIVPNDQSLFSVSIEELGVRDAAMSVIGQMGQSTGFILFSGLDDFEAFLAAAEAVRHGDPPVLPPHFALRFDRGAELGAALREEIRAHRWEVAGAGAYPSLIAVDADVVPRPPIAQEVTMAEAIALALPELLSEKEAVLGAWSGGEPVERTLSVSTHAGALEVKLRVPYERASAELGPPGELIAELFALGRSGEIDASERRRLEDELVRRFVRAPEAKALSDVHACHFIMDLAADYFGATIATLSAPELGEIVFEIIPRKVSIDASEAAWIIEESRAFYAFLKRELGLRQADACLRVLGGGAIEKLERALSEPSKFGMAKALLMGGREEGFRHGEPGGRRGVDARDGGAAAVPMGWLAAVARAHEESRRCASEEGPAKGRAQGAKEEPMMRSSPWLIDLGHDRAHECREAA